MVCVCVFPHLKKMLSSYLNLTTVILFNREREEKGLVARCYIHVRGDRLPLDQCWVRQVGECNNFIYINDGLNNREKYLETFINQFTKQTFVLA